MGKSSARGGGRRGHRVDVLEVFSRPKQSAVGQILGLVVRVRAELVVFGLLGLFVWWLVETTGSSLAAWLIFGGLVLVTMAVPHSRRFLLARMWCVYDRHRLRTCLVQTKIRTMNRDGSLPFMLWARPTKTGERVWLWVRAGSSGEDIADALEYISPACMAREARLHRVRSMTTVVAVEIIRRDPLGKPTPIASPLARLGQRLQGNQVSPEGTEPIRAASITDITSTATVTPITDYRGTAQRRTTRKKTATTTQPSGVDRPTVMSGGEDLSDYVD